MTFRGASNLTGTKIFIPRGKINLYNTQQGKYIPTVFLCDMQNPIEISANQKVTVVYEYRESIPFLDEGKCTLSMPNTIQKVEEITWETWERVGTQSVGPAPMNTTPVTLYFILSDPVQSMKDEVWWDFLDIACKAAKGENNESIIKDKLLYAVWHWMNNNINYSGYAANTEKMGGLFKPATYGNMTFLYNNMMLNATGNCQSASALFQICCNAVGIEMKLRYFLNKKSGTPLISAVFHTFSYIRLDVFVIGSIPDDKTGHMVATEFNGNEPNNNDLIYEATFRIPMDPKGTYNVHTHQWSTDFYAIKGVQFTGAGGYLDLYWPFNAKNNFEWYPQGQIKEVK